VNNFILPWSFRDVTCAWSAFSMIPMSCHVLETPGIGWFDWNIF